MSDRTELAAIEPRHAAALAELFERCRRPEVTRQFDPFPLDLASARRIAYHRGRDRYWAAVRAGEVVGLAMLRGFDEGFDVPAYGCLIDPAAQGNRLGRRMTAFAVREARQLGCARVRVSIYVDNAPSIRMCAAEGFAAVSREVVQREGETRERVIMVCDL